MRRSAARIQRTASRIGPPRRGRAWAPGAAVLVLGACLPAGIGAQQASAELRQLETHLDEARATAVHLLAPRSFGQAVNRLEDAARRLDSGRVDEELQDLLSEARRRLGEAERVADAARPRLERALAAREDARMGEAALRAAQLWQQAEEELEDAGGRFERGDQGGATERGARAALLYERAAVAAWGDMLLGEAKQARQAAMSTGASELSPAAFALGEGLLAAGEADIEAGRRGEGVAAAGQAARRAFDRSAGIAALADSVRRRTVSVERLVDAHESDLEAVAEAARVSAVRGRTAETVASISAELRRLQLENRRLEAELRDARSEIDRLSDRVAGAEERLAESESRFFAARDELLALRQRDERLREAQGLFTPEEGEVFLSGDQLVLRLFGLTFESGSADIVERHHPLLTKVQRVITTFEGAGVRIEGHTDSQGGAEANRALSQRRAIAVREHLLSRIPIPSSRVDAVGLGEDRPIGSNETEAGRARNRRIEVVITLAGGAGG